MKKNLIGQKFGKLTVLEQHGFTEKNKYGQRHAIWYCKCDCGNYVERTTDVLKRGKSSCGCSQKEHLKDMSKNNITHNHTHTGVYYSYKGMMSRCYREKDIHYHAYGERGITVCDEWRGKPKNFIKWALENGWREGLTIERKDNNKVYSPDNCIWIPKALQSKNKRQNIMITYNGKTLCAEDWSKITGISANTIRWRYKHGWDVEKIFKVPLPVPYKEE